MEKSFFDTICLVVNYTRPHYDSVPFLRRFYGAFPNIVFYGDSAFGKSVPDVISLPQDGKFGYRAILDAVTRFPDCEGYLFLMDDLLLNYWNLTRFSKSKIWCHSISGRNAVSVDVPDWQVDEWWWWRTPYGLNAYRKAWPKTPRWFRENMMEKFRLLAPAIRTPSDCFYLPKAFVPQFTEVVTLFSECGLFLELAIMSALQGLSKDGEKDYEALRLLYIWNNMPTGPDAAWRFSYNKNLDGIHPVKFSSLQNRATAEWLFDNPEADCDLSRYLAVKGGLRHLLYDLRGRLSSPVLFFRFLKNKKRPF